MTIRKVYFGSLGPFLYDDSDAINDPDGDFSGEDLHGMITDGPVKTTNTPTAATDVLRLDDLGGIIGYPLAIGNDVGSGTIYSILYITSLLKT